VELSDTPPRLWEVEVFGRDYVSQRRFVAGGASVHLTFTSGGLAVCPLHLQSAARLALDLCAGGELAALESESEGFSLPQSSTVLVFRLLARTHVSLRIGGPFSMRAGGELGIALTRDELVYGVAGVTRDLFGPSLLAAHADLGVLLSLP
jgi:hypothetical protein